MGSVYLERIAVTFMDSCLTDALKLRATAEFSRDIGTLLPYLNAVLEQASYDERADCLTVIKGTRVIEIYPGWMTIARAVNATDAFGLIQWVKDQVNETHLRRDELKPSLRYQRRATVMDIFNRLPQPAVNCGDCGEPTCMSFAARVWLGEETLANCTRIHRGADRAEPIETPRSTDPEAGA